MSPALPARSGTRLTQSRARPATNMIPSASASVKNGAPHAKSNQRLARPLSGGSVIITGIRITMLNSDGITNSSAILRLGSPQ